MSLPAFDSLEADMVRATDAMDTVAFASREDRLSAIRRMANHIQRTRAESRAEALEEAAKVCDSEAKDWVDGTPLKRCATSIRALKETP